MLATADLVQRCLQGDSRAWEQLVNRYARLVYSIPARYALSATEADDIFQDVYLALAQHLHEIQDAERLPAWLATTARRLVWRALYKRRQEQPDETETLGEAFDAPNAQTTLAPLPTVQELLENWQDQEAVAQGLQRLPERCRDLLALIFLDPAEPSYAEISERLGIPSGSIGPTRNRCLAHLRQLLEGLGFGRNE